MITLQEKYNKEAVPHMKDMFGYKNIYAVPRIEKIVINTGVGKIINTRKGKEVAEGDEDLIKDLILEFSLIVGQKPRIIRARKSISDFKLREGMIVGVSATLRGAKMYDFLARLIHIDFPRMRDFRGLEEKSIDKNGNMTIGIYEQIIFPEIPHDKVRQMWGMEVTIVTTAKNKKEGAELLKHLGMPFRDK